MISVKFKNIKLEDYDRLPLKSSSFLRMSQASAAAKLHQHQAAVNRFCLQVVYQAWPPKWVDNFASIGNNRQVFLSKTQRRTENRTRSQQSFEHLQMFKK